MMIVYLLLCRGVWAGEEQFTIQTDPPGAQVYLVLRGSIRNPGSESTRLIGPSGEPLLIPFPDQQTTVTVRLEHPHCLPYETELVRNPTERTKNFTLKYRTRWLQVQDWLAHWGPPLGLVVLAIGSPLVWMNRRKMGAVVAREREAEAMREKARLVTELIVPGETEDPFLGARLDEYRILQRLGEGGMARVYRAVPDLTMDETEAVAIKVMNQELARDPELVKRFQREKKVYESLNHPNIVKVLASGSYQQQFYLAMELVRGSTLRAYIFADGLPPKKALQLMTPVFEAVHFANQRGIVHRDLKPENIMITDQGQLKVMDFGLARGSNFSRVTATGSVLGTPAYMAPEQIEGNLDLRSDQYALGVMLYEMLSGKLPFYDDNPVTIIISHLTKPVHPLVEIKPDLVKLGPAVERMLAKKPEERYRDLEHALTSLRYAL